jgi:hypothetical protein
MARNRYGQFEKGTCGNPRGRPRKMPLRISEDQLRERFFQAAETLIPVVQDGKRMLIPAREAIEQQLVRKAASGDMRAICEYNRRSDNYTMAHVKEQLGRLETICNGEDRIRQFPEDVTDEFKNALRLLRLSLDPYFRI